MGFHTFFGFFCIAGLVIMPKIFGFNYIKLYIFFSLENPMHIYYVFVVNRSTWQRLLLFWILWDWLWWLMHTVWGKPHFNQGLQTEKQDERAQLMENLPSIDVWNYTHRYNITYCIYLSLHCWHTRRRFGRCGCTIFVWYYETTKSSAKIDIISRE